MTLPLRAEPPDSVPESFAVNESAQPDPADAEIHRQADEVECVVLERRAHIRAMRENKKGHYPQEVIALSEARLAILQRAARTMRAIANNAPAVRAVLKGGR
jgi:hypothetical protein